VERPWWSSGTNAHPSAAMADEKKEVAGGDAINLKVVTQDGNEIFFKARVSAPDRPDCSGI